VTGTFSKWILRSLTAVLLLVGAMSYAQNPNATVSGAVTDTTGAVVPNAAVVFTNVSTGIPYKTVSNGDGQYRLNGLIPGVYRGEAQQQGFKSVVKDNITLHVEDQVAINFAMEVGSLEQSVVVEAGEPLIDSQSTSLGQVIEGRQVQDTPLNGRNAMNLVALVPGVVPGGTTSGGASSNQGSASANPAGFANYQIGGGISGWNATFIDGAPANVSGQNWQALVPTQDSVGEFKVDTNAVTPQYGRCAGGVISFSTKSGGNQFHGSLYEYLRNTDFDANDFFNIRNGLPRPVLHQNQFGGTVEGPIVKDKTFFFFSYESTRLATTGSYVALVPDANFLAGNFSGFPGANNTAGNSFYDPKAGGPANYGGQPNHVNPANFDPTALAMVKMGYFAPANAENLMPTYNSEGVNHQSNVANQYVARIDQQLTSRQRLFGRYTYWNIDIPPQTGSNPSPILPPAGMTLTTNQGVLGDNYTFSPTLNGDFRVSYTRFIFNAGLTNGAPYYSALGPNWVTVGEQEGIKTLPTMYPSGGSLWTNAPSTFNNLQYNHDDNYSASAAFTKVIGQHTLVFGAEDRRIEWYNQATINSGGNFMFNGSNAMINFLEGVVTPSTGQGVITTTSAPSAYSYYQGYYVTDTYKVTPKLTVNYGLRWELPGAWYVRGDNNAVLMPNAASPLGSIANPATGGSEVLTGILAPVNSPQYGSHAQTQLHLHLFEPRLGLNYEIDPQTSFHAGFGISHPCIDCGSYTTSPSASSVNSASTVDSTSLSNPYPGGILQPLGRNLNLMQPATQFAQTLEGSAIAAQQPDQTYPYVMQWNANLEHAINGSTSFSLSYAGSRGLHLGTQDINLNQLPDQYDSLGSQLLTEVKNPLYGMLSATSTLNAPQVYDGQMLLPHPQFSTFSSAGEYRGESIYHSFIATLQKRFAAGSSVNAAYTWAHLISNVDSPNGYLEPGEPGNGFGAQDFTNPGADRSNSAQDVRQRLVISYVLDIPVGKGKRFLGSVNGWEDKVVSGWGLNGISTFQSGLPLGFTYQPGTVLQNYFGAGQARPNVVEGCAKSISGSPTGRINEWFNTSCFSAPSQYGFGNESRLDSSLRAQGIDNFDLNLSKTTSIREGISLQFRAEMFNLFNHPQFAPPNTALDSGTFGQVTADANQPRIGQFSVRLLY
jgi:hypothetical protein